MLVELEEFYFELYENYLRSYIIEAKIHAQKLANTIFSIEYTAEETAETLRYLHLINNDIIMHQSHLDSRDSYFRSLDEGIYWSGASGFEFILQGKNDKRYLNWVTEARMSETSALHYLYGKSLRHKGTAKSIHELKRYIAMIPEFERLDAPNPMTFDRISWSESANIILVKDNPDGSIEWRIIFLDEWKEANRQKWSEWNHNFYSFTPNHLQFMV